MTIITINNSFCELSKDIPANILATIKEVLTYKNDIQAERSNLFFRMRYAKSSGNNKLVGFLSKQIKELEANEIVCWLNGHRFPTGHINIVKDTLNAINHSFKLNDIRVVPESDFIAPWKNPPWKPRYYQKEMIDIGLLEHRGVFEASVGSGKSLVMTYLLQKIGVNSLIVVPSRGLLEQLYQDLVTYFGPNRVQQINTVKLRTGSKLKAIRITTIQTLASLKKSGDLPLLVSDTSAIYIDEAHHAASASFTGLLEDISHIYYRFSFTGTYLRADAKTLDLWGFCGTKIYSYPAYKAISDGFLTPLTAIVHKIDGISKYKYQTEYKANYAGGIAILERILEIVSNNPHDQILILVNLKEQSGKIINGYLSTMGYVNEFISGDDTKEHITDSISAFNDKRIRILIGSKVIGEGIDVRSTDHLILACGGKSEVAIVQAIGRCVRKYEGKEVAYVHDFDFVGTKYMSKHLKMRIDIMRNTFEAEIIRIG